MQGRHARALNCDISVSQTSWDREIILGRNSVFRVFFHIIGFVRSDSISQYIIVKLVVEHRDTGQGPERPITEQLCNRYFGNNKHIHSFSTQKPRDTRVEHLPG